MSRGIWLPGHYGTFMKKKNQVRRDDASGRWTTISYILMNNNAI